MFAFFTLRAFRHVISSLLWLLISSLIFSSLYGLSDEWHQYYVPGRMSDVADWVADTLGAVLLLSGYYAGKKVRGAIPYLTTHLDSIHVVNHSPQAH